MKLSFLFAPITSDEYHTWFHLYGLGWAAKNAKQAKTTVWHILVNSGIRIHALHDLQLRIPARCSHDQKEIHLKEIFMIIVAFDLLSHEFFPELWFVTY